MGVQMHRTPDEILKNFLDEWEKIQAEYAAKNPFYKKAMDSQKAYAEKIVPFKLSWFPPYNSPASTTGRTRSICRRSDLARSTRHNRRPDHLTPVRSERRDH